MEINRTADPLPWGCPRRFQNVHTYAPRFHQPCAMKHIDQNSTLDLGWDVKPREKPKSVVDEMKDTLDRINDLLIDLSSRGKTSVRKAEPGQMKDNTINSCLESLCDDISQVSKDLKSVKNHQEGRKGSVTSSVTSSPATTTVKLSDNTSDGVEEIKDSSPPRETRDHHPSSSSSSSDNGLRKRVYTDSKMTCMYRGSDVSKVVSMHKSSFTSTAALCGYDGTELQPRRVLRTASQMKRSEELKSGGVYFAEYPPQRGSHKFRGVFEDDITALFDQTSRGLIIL